MPRKVFTAGEVLAASDVNSFLMDQTVMVFAGTAARGSAIGTATEGMYAHLNDTDTLTYYDGSAWVNRIGPAGILQVVTSSTSTRVANSTTTLADTGLSATITPISATSRILVMVNQNGVSKYAGNVGNGLTLRLQKNSSNVALMGDFLAYTGTSIANIITASIIYTDTPGSLSPITYKTVFANIVNASQVTVQELSDLSTITLMEIEI